MVTTGSFVTAFDKLTSSKQHAQRIVCMRAYLSSVILLDKHRFRSEQVPQGFVLAALRLYKNVSDRKLVKAYIDGLAEAYEKGSSYATAPIKKAFRQFELVRESFGEAGIGGSTATAAIGEAVEGAFEAYALESAGATLKSILVPGAYSVSPVKLS